jgi:hypothetical protein
MRAGEAMEAGRYCFSAHSVTSDDISKGLRECCRFVFHQLDTS